MDVQSQANLTRRHAPQTHVKKIPRELRRLPVIIPRNLNAFQRWLLKLKLDSQFLRFHVQAGFLLLCVWIGKEFVWFVRWLEGGGLGSAPTRPPGVEGFLPLSALVGLKHFFLTGQLNQIHPASVFIFLAIVALGVLLKKSFCSWLCPVGWLAEMHWRLGRKILRDNLSVPKWLDYPLRSLKYLLLFFFVYVILWQMGLRELTSFLASDYNKVADIKMLYFFEHPGRTTLMTLLILSLLSLPIKNFWCRYLCPYGALLGTLSLISPAKVRRNSKTCIDCTLCTKACPANIPVHRLDQVHSDECTACLACVQACPVRDTLDLRTAVKGRRVPPVVFAVFIVAFFAAITGFGMLAGYWQNALSNSDYLRLMPAIHSFGHPGQ